jgi:hypothetical protein
VLELQRFITAERYERYLNTSQRAIVDRSASEGERAQARLEIQADDIDGVTWLDAGQSHVPGTIIEVTPHVVLDDYDFAARGSRVLVPAPQNSTLQRRQLPLVATSVGSFGRA